MNKNTDPVKNSPHLPKRIPMNEKQSISGHINVIKSIAKFGAVLSAIVLIILTIWIVYSYTVMTDQAGKIAQAANAPEEVGQLIGGAFFGMLAFPVTFLFISVWIHSILSFRSPWKAIGRIAFYMFLVGLIALIPRGIGFLTNSDPAGVPRVMRPANPHSETWFRPDGSHALYYTRENNRLRFWKDEGYTPDSRVKSTPVTPAIWEEFKRSSSGAARESGRVQAAPSSSEVTKLTAQLNSRQRETVRLQNKVRELKSPPKPTPSPKNEEGPNYFGFRLRPGQQKVIPNRGGIIKRADWYDVYTILVLDFGNARKQYQGWNNSDIWISPSEMRRAKYFVYIRPTEAEFRNMVRSGKYRYKRSVPNPRVAGYDITLGDFRR